MQQTQGAADVLPLNISGGIVIGTLATTDRVDGHVES